MKARDVTLRSLPIILFLVVAYLVFVQTPDDAFITYRFAANLVNGHGPVFNPGERVEGFSSPLHLLLSAALMLGFSSYDILLPAKLAGVLFGAATLLMMQPLGRRLGLEQREVLLAQLFVALNPNFALSASNGLETSLYAFLIALTAWAYLGEVQRKSGWLSGLLTFVLLFTRPDGSIIFAALFVLRVIEARRHGLPISRFVAPWTTAFLVPAVALVLSRFAYYGAPLPNTYYAKDTPLAFGIPQGVRYLTKAMAARTNHIFTGVSLLTKVILIASVPIYWGTLLLGAWQALRRGQLWICLAITCATVVFVLKAGGDWMEGWRFCAPAIPIMALLQSFGLRALTERMSNPRRDHAFGVHTASTVLVGFWLIAATTAPRRPWHTIGFETEGRRFLAASIDPQISGLMQVSVGDWVKGNLPSGSSLAYAEIGYAGLASLDKHFVDFYGLVTAQVAHAVPTERKTQLGSIDKEWFKKDSPVGQVLLELRPQFIVFPGPFTASVLGAYRLRAVLPRTVTHGDPVCVYELTSTADTTAVPQEPIVEREPPALGHPNARSGE